MKSILAIATVLLSTNAFAAGLIGHWQGNTPDALTCDNGYKAACTSNLSLNVDGENFTFESSFNCGLPGFYISTGRDVSVKSNQIYYYFSSQYLNCGKLDATELVLKSDSWCDQMMSRGSTYSPLKVTKSDYTFTLNAKGELEYSVPVTIYDHSCTAKGSMKPVFP